jgi:flavin reductase (DIM6/NTAB) family NADH-FMN oxidoreductase RutF
MKSSFRAEYPFSEESPAHVNLWSCGSGEKANIMPVSWNSPAGDRKIVGAIRPSRHSYRLLMEIGEWWVNIPGAELVNDIIYCGNVSGRDTDKWQDTGLTKGFSELTEIPYVNDCMVNNLYRLERTLDAGSHTLFIGRLVESLVEEDFVLDDGSYDISGVNPVLFHQGKLYDFKGNFLRSYVYGK